MVLKSAVDGVQLTVFSANGFDANFVPGRHSQFLQPSEVVVHGCKQIRYN